MSHDDARTTMALPINDDNVGGVDARSGDIGYSCGCTGFLCTHTCDLININELAIMVTCGTYECSLYVGTVITDLMIDEIVLFLMCRRRIGKRVLVGSCVACPTYAARVQSGVDCGDLVHFDATQHR